MIFFSVWLYACSREVLRESFDFPQTSTTIGILGILVNHPTPTHSNPLWLAFGFDLFQPSIQSNEPKPKTPATRSAPPLTCPSLRLTAASGSAPLRRSKHLITTPVQLHYNSTINPIKTQKTYIF